MHVDEPATDGARDDDGIDRRGMLKCMAWVGTGLFWGVSGGVASACVLGQAPAARPTFTFAQISDSHLGFSREPNKDVAGTLARTVAKINALPEPPAFVLHTGDITHNAKPEEFDAAAEILKGVRGRPGGDLDALAKLLVGLSQLVADAGDAIAEIDLNPVIVYTPGQGVVAVDHLIVARAQEAAPARHAEVIAGE